MPNMKCKAGPNGYKQIVFAALLERHRFAISFGYRLSTSIMKVMPSFPKLRQGRLRQSCHRLPCLWVCFPARRAFVVSHSLAALPSEGPGYCRSCHQFPRQCAEHLCSLRWDQTSSGACAGPVGDHSAAATSRERQEWLLHLLSGCAGVDP